MLLARLFILLHPPLPLAGVSNGKKHFRVLKQRLLQAMLLGALEAPAPALAALAAGAGGLFGGEEASRGPQPSWLTPYGEPVLQL